MIWRWPLPSPAEVVSRRPGVRDWRWRRRWWRA